MINDPLFQYLKDNRTTISQNLYKERSLYKEYLRSESITLPKASPVLTDLSSLLLARRSRREYGDDSLTVNDISSILYWSAGIATNRDGSGERRMQPSGGAKYPIELYIVACREGSIGKGVYHYNVKKHSLEKLQTTDEIDILNCLPKHDEYAKKSHFLVLFSFVKNRSYKKYGALAYKLAFLEAGHISQMMYLVTESLGHACCGLGTADGSEYDKALKIDLVDEYVFYALAIGTRSKESYN